MYIWKAVYAHFYRVIEHMYDIFHDKKKNHKVSDVLPDHIKSFCSTENQERPIYQLLRQWQRSSQQLNLPKCF